MKSEADATNNIKAKEKEKKPPKRGKTRLRPEKTFLVIDFYEDKNKFRWIFPLATLLVFIFVVFTIIVSGKKEVKEASKIQLSVEPANYQVIGTNQSSLREPGITVLDKYDVYIYIYYIYIILEPC